MKIKRIVSAITAATIVLSLTACSDNASTSNLFDNFNSDSSSESSSSSLNFGSSSSSSSSSSKASSSSSSTSSKKESSSSSSESKPEETTGTPLITRYYSNDYGTGVFEFTADDKKRYAYNIAENTLIELGEDNSGIMCAMGNLLYDGRYIIDAKSQEVVLQYDKDGYKIRNVSETLGIILITKLEEGFSGNKLFIGTMNSKGEWDNPLTEISIDKITASRLNNYSFRLLGDNVLIINNNDSYIYSLSKKEISPVKTPDNSNLNLIGALWNNAGNQAIIGAYNQSKKGYEVFCFDDSAEFQLICSYNGGYNYTSNDSIYVFSNKKIYTLINPKTLEAISSFDLSEYNYSNIYSLNEKWVVFSARNPDGDLYTIILDKDGNFVVDPIKDTGRFAPYICNDCVILNQNTIVNCNTGEVKTTDYKIEKGYFNYGLIVVKSGKNYYLVKPSEPDKLINPFEIAKRI